MRDLSLSATSEIAGNVAPVDSGKETLLATREAVIDGWRSVSAQLRSDGYSELAQHVDRFIEQMPRVRTDREAMAEDARARSRPQPPVQPPRI